MFWKYAIKRILYGILAFVVIMFIYSVLFNTIMEKTIYDQITERIENEILAMGDIDMSGEKLELYKVQRYEYFVKKYHLNEPTLQRIFWRAIDTITFNFGKSSGITSPYGDREVIKIVGRAVPKTLLLFTTVVFIDVILGILLGLKKAQKPNKKFDQATSMMTMVVYGIPGWWMAMICIMFFVYIIPVFPSGGLHSIPPPTNGFAYFIDLIYHLALPVLVLVAIGFWGRAYLIRNIVLGTLQEDFIMSARARGLSERKVLYGHTMRTAAPPIATMALMSLLATVGGNLVYEGIFNWPGMGNLYWIAIQQNDIPVLLGLLAVTTTLYLSGLVILDLIYGFLDPRIKVGGKA